MSSNEPSAPEDAGKFYDQMWDRYGHLAAVNPAAFHRRRLIVKLCQRFGRGVTQILDAGCGQGELARELQRAFPSAALSASDVSQTSVEETQRLNPSLNVLHMDLSRLDFEVEYRSYLGRFDLITCSEVIEHIPDDGRAVQSLSRLLSPGGILVITVPGGKMSRFDELIGHQRHYSAGALRELVASGGLETRELLAWGFPFQNLYRSAVRVASRLRPPSMTEQASSDKSGLDRALLAGYWLFGRALKPLFYANRNYWGEQMLVVAAHALLSNPERA